MTFMMLNIDHRNVDDLVVFVSFLIDIKDKKRYLDFNGYIGFHLQIMNFKCSIPSNLKYIAQLRRLILVITQIKPVGAALITSSFNA